jgi:hypothetical protein
MSWEDFLSARRKRLELQRLHESCVRQSQEGPSETDKKQQAVFTSRFRSIIDNVITPSFGKCVQSLTQYGIRAQQVDHMNRVHPNVSLDIVFNRQNSCKVMLSPMETEGKVGMRVLICKHNEWNYEDATRVEVEQVTESLIREKVQEAIDALDDE